MTLELWLGALLCAISALDLLDVGGSKVWKQ